MLPSILPTKRVQKLATWIVHGHTAKGTKVHDLSPMCVGRLQNVVCGRRNEIHKAASPARTVRPGLSPANYRRTTFIAAPIRKSIVRRSLGSTRGIVRWDIGAASRTLQGARTMMAAALARPLRVTLVVLLVFPGLCDARYQAAVCPSDSMIHPCSCTRVAFGIRVRCSGIANEHSLRIILGYLSSYKLNALSLEHINFTLTPDLFDRLEVIEVKVMESQFRMENPFELHATGGVSRIEALNVRQSTLDLGDSSLAILQGLRRVDVVNSAIRVLRRRWFNGMSHLDRLVIEHTKMGSLEDRALAGLNEVERVVLKANELKSLRRSYFPELAARLAHLDFSDNELTSLPPDMFNNMPVLESVTLSRNHFQTLSPEPWKPMLGQLQLVKLDENPIDCNGTISWMLQGNARHKVVGTCAAPPNLAGTRISDLDDSRLRR